MSFLLYHQGWTLTLQKTTTRKKACLPFEQTFIWHKFTLGSLSLQALLELAKDFNKENTSFDQGKSLEIMYLKPFLRK